MTIIPYNDSMSQKTLDMIKETITTVNLKDYSEKQVQAWAEIDSDSFRESINEYSFIAINEFNEIIGFIDGTEEGYIDRLFVHKNYQTQGVASRLLHSFEETIISSKFSANVSITAKYFFKAKGYQVKKENAIELRGEKFINYLMTKEGK